MLSFLDQEGLLGPERLELLDSWKAARPGAATPASPPTTGSRQKPTTWTVAMETIDGFLAGLVLVVVITGALADLLPARR